MSAILVIENDKAIAENISEALTTEGYFAVTAVSGDRDRLYSMIVAKWFDAVEMEKMGISKWCAIVLDINYDRDHWGGVALYNALAQSHRASWNHTIVYSVYAPSDKEGRSTLSSVTDDTKDA